MAQITKGWTFATGDSVTADNLNALVGGATVTAEVITGQSPIPSVDANTQVLASNGSSLSKATVAQIVTGANLFDKSLSQTLGKNVSFASGASVSLASGSAMTLSSGAILTLGQNPTSAFHAVPKQYADTFLPKSGGTLTGALTLSGDPTAVLQAAPKQYVDTQVAAAGQVKAWGAFVGDEDVLLVPIIAIYNISSIAEVSSVFTVTFATPFNNANYAVVTGGARNATSGSSTGYVTPAFNLTETSFQLKTYGSSPADWGYVTFIVCK